MPAVVIPGVIFTVLALWPFLEARATHDTAWHHFAQKPRQAPVRSAIGAGGLTFFIVLTLAGSNDVLAKFLDVEVDTLNVYLKSAVFVLPIVVAFATYRICRDLGARDPHPMTHPERVVVRRNAEGGFDTEHGEPAGTETRG
jgi:ubiquinol-cytochrome c reductase cytochrome b subunit